MKLPLRHVTLALLVAFSTARAFPAQAVPATQTKSAPVHQVLWSQVETEEVRAIKLDIKIVTQQGQQSGAMNKPELEKLQTKLEWAERRQPLEVHINFPGGPLADLVEQLKGPEGVAFTVISTGSEPFLPTELPAFSIRNASLIVVAKVIGNLLDSRGIHLRILDDSKPNWVVGMLQRVRPESDTLTPPNAFESIQLEEYLNSGYTIDTIVEAIRTAWELDPKNPRDALKLKYHPPTKILLVSGPTQAVIVTKVVIGTLRKKPVTP